MSGKWVTSGKWTATIAGLAAMVLAVVGLAVVGFFIFMAVALSNFGSNK